MGSRPIDVPVSDAERIAYADPWTAMVRAVEDALADLTEAERHTQRRERPISKGYVRSRLDTTER